MCYDFMHTHRLKRITNTWENYIYEDNTLNELKFPY